MGGVEVGNHDDISWRFEVAGQKFEDLECWQLAREMSRVVYDLTKRPECCRDYHYTDQMRRAAVSVMNNIAEGYERGSSKDFVKFLYIARASAGEVRSMTYIGLDQAYLSNADFEVIQSLSRRCSAMCWGLIKARASKLGLAAKTSLVLFLVLCPLLNRLNP